MSHDAFEAEWTRCAPWIEAALEQGGGTHTVDDVKAAVCAREARFWAGRNAALVTRREDYPRFSVLMLWLGAGDLAELCDELRPMAEAYARDTGCRKVWIAGRPGWARAVGYEPAFAVCEREL